MKRVLAVSDISCVGKCSLTVALPIVSAFGIECSVLPTAILSTHTAFSNFSFLSLSDELSKIEEVFEKENISFSAIFAGYLGRESDIDFIKNEYFNIFYHLLNNKKDIVSTTISLYFLY